MRSALVAVYPQPASSDRFQDKPRSLRRCSTSFMRNGQPFSAGRPNCCCNASPSGLSVMMSSVALKCVRLGNLPTAVRAGICGWKRETNQTPLGAAPSSNLHRDFTAKPSPRPAGEIVGWLWFDFHQNGYAPVPDGNRARLLWSAKAAPKPSGRGAISAENAPGVVFEARLLIILNSDFGSCCRSPSITPIGVKNLRRQCSSSPGVFIIQPDVVRVTTKLL